MGTESGWGLRVGEEAERAVSECHLEAPSILTYPCLIALLRFTSCSLLEVRRLFTTDHIAWGCLQTPIGRAETLLFFRSDANDQVRYTANLATACTNMDATSNDCRDGNFYRKLHLNCIIYLYWARGVGQLTGREAKGRGRKKQFQNEGL